MYDIEAVCKVLLQQQAYRVLRNAILSGNLQRHTIYSIGQVAQILNVSRTSVTTAVQTIAGEGLITVLPNQDFCVYEFSEDDTREVFELRKAVEGYAFRKVYRKKCRHFGTSFTPQGTRSLFNGNHEILLK